MPKSTLLVITRVSRNDTEYFVEFRTSDSDTPFIWTCPAPANSLVLHHELILLKFLTSNLEVFCSEIISQIEIECLVGFSKTFRELFDLVQKIEPRIQDRVQIKYNSLTLVHPVFELEEPKGVEQRQYFETAVSEPQPLVNVRIIDALLSSLITNFGCREKQGRALFANSLIWTVENSRHMYTNGYAATRFFLDVLQRAIRNLIGQAVLFSVDFVDEERDYYLLSMYSDQPQDFEACVPALIQMSPGVASSNAVSACPVERKLVDWNVMDDIERRATMSTLPTGLEPLIYKYLTRVTPKKDLSPPQRHSDRTYFWTKMGWAYFGAVRNTNVRWGMLYEEV
ncbi:hypothetical protein D3C74_35150 [compost metagenome]